MDEKLKPGTILRLTRDVANPHPDRRARRFERQPVWNKATEFYVFAGVGGRELRAWGGRIHESDEGFADVVDACEVREPDFYTTMLRINGGGGRLDRSMAILERLVQSGKLTLGDIDGAFQEIRMRSAAEEAA